MRYRVIFAAVSCLALVLPLAGCPDAENGDTPPDQVPAEPGASANAAYDPATSTARVSGVVSFDGTAPEPAKLQIAGDYCPCRWEDRDAWDEKLVVNPDGSLPNAFVWALKGPHEKLGYVTPGPFEMRQVDCMYVPHVSGIMTGQDLVVSNPDDTSHNVHYKSKRHGEGNVLQARGQKNTFVFDKVETPIPFNCDLHSWMAAFVFVVDHPFFAVTDAEGRFEISGLPAGDYVFKAWHETFGTRKLDVTIADGAAASIEFTLE